MRYTVSAHSDSFTIRDSLAGDILTFPLSPRDPLTPTVYTIAAKLNAAYEAGQHDMATSDDTQRGWYDRAYKRGRTDALSEAARNTQALASMDTDREV